MSKKILLAVGVAAALTAGAATAEETNGVIVHRQGIYKIASGHVTALKAMLMLKNGPTGHAAFHADGVVEAFKHMGDAYPAGSDVGETKAKPNIWTERAKFDEAGKKAFGAALAMADAAKAGDNGKSVDALKALVGTCKACHEDFKKD